MILGVLYLQGISGTPDFEQARQWLQRAVDNGNENAREILKQIEQARQAIGQ